MIDVIRSYYPDGSIASECYYDSDKLLKQDGTYDYLYTANKAIKLEYRVANSEGIYVTYYHKSGKVHFIIFVLDNDKNYFKSIHYYDTDTNSVCSENYLYIIGRRGNSHRINGPAWISYDEDGSIRKEEYWLDGTKLDPFQVLVYKAAL
jgi:antitoxin component YwqK of YwqJK toxin-antitoxin module